MTQSLAVGKGQIQDGNSSYLAPESVLSAIVCCCYTHTHAHTRTYTHAHTRTHMHAHTFYRTLLCMMRLYIFYRAFSNAVWDSLNFITTQYAAWKWIVPPGIAQCSAVALTLMRWHPEFIKLGPRVWTLASESDQSHLHYQSDYVLIYDLKKVTVKLQLLCVSITYLLRELNRVMKFKHLAEDPSCIHCVYYFGAWSWLD